MSVDLEASEQSRAKLWIKRLRYFRGPIGFGLGRPMCHPRQRHTAEFLPVDADLVRPSVRAELLADAHNGFGRRSRAAGLTRITLGEFNGRDQLSAKRLSDAGADYFCKPRF